MLINPALADALGWFHQPLDRELPEDADHDTSHNYYREGCGWDADTIDEKLLRFAPANYRDELVTYLFHRGHGREEILATGLFGERDDGNLYATWSGRYVLPYFDAEGVLEYVDGIKHYGNVLESNEFDDTWLGAVIGSNHYGDGYIKKWGACAGEAVDRSEEKGADLTYSGFGDDVLQHMRDTLQAAMRFGRDGNGDIVYVHTDTLPEWVLLAGEGECSQPGATA